MKKTLFLIIGFILSMQMICIAAEPIKYNKLTANLYAIGRLIEASDQMYGKNLFMTEYVRDIPRYDTFINTNNGNMVMVTFPHKTKKLHAMVLLKINKDGCLVIDGCSFFMGSIENQIEKAKNPPDSDSI